MRGQKDALATAVGPISHSAMDEAEIPRSARLVTLWIEYPDRFPRRRIDGRDLAQSCGCDQPAADHQRRILKREGAGCALVGLQRHIGGFPRPRNPQAANIVSINLVER